jgi:hypothetical protein
MESNFWLGSFEFIGFSVSWISQSISLKLVQNAETGHTRQSGLIRFVLFPGAEQLRFHLDSRILIRTSDVAWIRSQFLGSCHPLREVAISARDR